MCVRCGGCVCEGVSVRCVGHFRRRKNRWKVDFRQSLKTQNIIIIIIIVM